VPINIKAFEAATPPEVDNMKFRVTDLLVLQDNGKTELLSAHHFWRENLNCYVLRISVMDITPGLSEQSNDNGSWKTLFDSEPCLPFKKKGHAFAGHQAGGRMAKFDTHTILLTIGDHEFDGQASDQDFPQDPLTSYGKTVLVDTRTGDAEIFSIGHRNPQGLYIDSSGLVWETEHGPQGGDELNLIARGQNYGWPLVTYGSDYGTRAWPQNKAQGRHNGFVLPVYAWVPSVGISNLIGVDSDEFPLWKGDLLVASMRGNTIFRLRIREKRVIFAESIDVNMRIRDLVQAPDGQIILWTDRSELVTLEPVSADSLVSTFSSYCSGCHDIGDGSSHGIGPDLHGIFEAPAASAAGFEYSEAIRQSKVTWTRNNLDKYLTNPRSVIPGTTMNFPGIAEPTTRTRLIEYLKENG
jgi:cytochrome c2